MILKTINRVKFIRKFHLKQGEKWTNNKVKRFINFLPKEDKILDLGSGNCMVASNLSKQGYDITAMDVNDLSNIESIKPIVYDGSNIPCENDSFDTVLILTVLHHSKEPEVVIREAKRVGKKIIIIEDTFKNRVQKKMTQFMDTIVNLGHSEMTYNNKSEEEWEAIFREENLTVLEKSNKSVLLFFRQTTYQVSK